MRVKTEMIRHTFTTRLEQCKKNAVTVAVDPYKGLQPEKTIMAHMLRIAVAYIIVIIACFLLN